jgi:divalent metal cation (Fe/Co/Zn/Cd) transporter
MTHSPLIERIDTVRAYYSGPRIVTEVDIVLDRNERVEVAHDVAEELQIKLEKLPSIERAFVHIDYETSHKPVSSISSDTPNHVSLPYRSFPLFFI